MAFPSEDAALKVMYLALRNVIRKWDKSIHWKAALNCFTVLWEDRIQAARRFYNGNVRDYRNKCETFPSNFVAKMFAFKSEDDFFSVPPSVRDVPNVDFATAT